MLCGSALKSSESVKIYFVTLSAHKFLHIRNYESDGYSEHGKIVNMRKR